jgi:hypothetical protein
MVDFVAARIADEGEIRQSRQFPYQYQLRTFATSVGAARLMAELDAEAAAILSEWRGKSS